MSGQMLLAALELASRLAVTRRTPRLSASTVTVSTVWSGAPAPNVQSHRLIPSLDEASPADEASLHDIVRWVNHERSAWTSAGGLPRGVSEGAVEPSQAITAPNARPTRIVSRAC